MLAVLFYFVLGIVVVVVVIIVVIVLVVVKMIIVIVVIIVVAIVLLCFEFQVDLLALKRTDVLFCLVAHVFSIPVNMFSLDNRNSNH